MLKLSNNNDLPGVLGGALAPLKKALPIALGFILFPGMAAYFADNTGKTVRPPLNNLTVITYTAAPASGETLSATVNGVTYTQAWDTDAATTMTAFAVKIQANADVATATKNAGNTAITVTAEAGKQAIVSAASNSNGAKTAAITSNTTDTFAGMVVRDRSEARDGVLKYEAPRIVTLLVDGDSCRAGVGGEDAATWNINSDVYVRVVEGDTAAGEYKGQIVAGAGPAAKTYAVAVSALSFEGAGTVGDYENIHVNKG